MKKVTDIIEIKDMDAYDQEDQVYVWLGDPKAEWFYQAIDNGTIEVVYDDNGSFDHISVVESSNWPQIGYSGHFVFNLDGFILIKHTASILIMAAFVIDTLYGTKNDI